MKRNCLNAEKLAALILKALSITACAEGEENSTGINKDPEPQASASPNPINYEELIAHARREEKDKLYPQINKLKEDLKTMTQLNNDNLLKIADLEKQLKSTSGDKSAKEIEKLTKEIEVLKGELSDQPEIVSEEEMRSKIESEIRTSIEAEYEVKLYKTEKISELKEEILPVFAELIEGDTKEELDLSIEWAKTKTKETKDSLGITEEPQKKEPAKRPSKTNPSNSVIEDKTYDAEYIRNIPADSPEWAEVRKALGLDKFN